MNIPHRNDALAWRKPMNTIGVVVQTNPLDRDFVQSQLEHIPGCRLFHNDGSGRIIVTVERIKKKSEQSILKDLNSIPKVINTRVSFITAGNIAGGFPMPVHSTS